jgi:succinoglycan biosynthesis protein ExoM
MNVAVCICTCNRPAGLERLLTALATIDLTRRTPDRLEIIVVDNRPGGPARAICVTHQARLGVHLHFCEEPTPGISFARNRAVAEALARGADFIAFLDDDDVPSSDWLLRLLEKQDETNADIVGGIWRLADDFRAPKYMARVHVLKTPDFDQPNHFGVPDCGCNVLIGRSAIERLGEPPYRPQFAWTGGEDIDFVMRAVKAGARVVEARASVVMKDPGAQRATFTGTLRHAFSSGCCRARLTLEHLPRERAAKLRRRVPKRLAKSIKRLSRFSVPQSVAALEGLAWVMGEFYGLLGGSYAYYRRRSGLTPRHRHSV